MTRPPLREFSHKEAQKYSLSILHACAPVDANVIHQHCLREHGGFVRTSGPISANCHVENNEERLVEYPLLARRNISGSSRAIENAVAIKTDNVRLPLD